MNLPIRPEPPVLDFPAPSQAPNKSTKAGEKENFADLLNQELGDVPEGGDQEKEPTTEKKESTKSTVDAWTLYGVVPLTVQIAVPTNTAAVEGTAEKTDSEGKAECIPEGQVVQSSEAKSPDQSPRISEESPPLSEIPAELLAKLEKSPNQPKVAENIENNPPAPSNSAENAQKPAKEASKPDGILVAQQEIMLRPSQKKDEIAASGKGDAHIRNDSSDTANANPVQNELKPAAARFQKISVLNEALGQKRSEQPIKIDFSPTESFPVQKHHPDPVSPSELTPTRAASVDSVVETVHNHVQLLRYSGVDRMELVFRPDKDTQLFIQVAKVNGEIQVQARWERGDLNHVAAQWSQVQQSLANQGIRVEPLQYSATTSFSSPNFSGQQQAGRDDSGGASAASNQLNPGQKKSGPTSAASKPSQTHKGGTGWQSWA